MKVQQPKQLLQQIIQQNQLAHAYLFVGERGTGKRETAKWLAKRIFCTNLQDGNPCGQCKNCVRIQDDNHPDVIFIKPDGNNIKVEQIQALRDEFSLQSTEGGAKFYCLEDADLLTTNASNRLLTFLEEPPANTYGILMTTHLDSMLPTIISRCQPMYFARKQPQAIFEALQERNVSAAQARLLSYLTSDLTLAEQMANDEVIKQQLDISTKWFELLIKRDEMAFVFVQQKLITLFKKKEDYQLLYDILLILTKQYIATNQYVDYTSQILLSDLDQVQYKLKFNVNPQNICEQLAIHCLKQARWNDETNCRCSTGATQKN